MVYSIKGLKRTMGILCLSVSLIPAVTRAQDKTSTISRKGYTLVFTDKSTDLDSTVKARLISTFFTVYPAEAKRYNKNTVKKVDFVIDPAYDGVAATSGSVITFNPEWFRKHPGDIDVVTHEGMHVVQAYPEYNPGWLTEGIADYVRATMGVDNEGAHWTLPDYNEKQSYKNAYRVTARFLIWLEKHKRKDMVAKLDKAMRTNTYTDGIWTELTGKTVDELWQEYGANPVL
ncbi:basic secretory protein-like protein [Chitinophaga sp.]|uniref:basic secretory protein-like protein n=1 Tax=Chitinophaga sp. TaxID=1869181 RepID=UPI0031D1EBC1